MASLLRTFFKAGMLLFSLTFLTGIIYPAIVTIIAQITFSHKANGSLIIRDEKVIGSELIGQEFTDPRHFWGRPSATIPPYNAADSHGSNWSPGNPELIEAVKQRSQRLQSADTKNKNPIPIDLVTASASGLDPHISIAAAEYQIGRVARHSQLTEQQVRELVNQHTDTDFLDYGEPRVNVLLLNLELDAMQAKEK